MTSVAKIHQPAGALDVRGLEKMTAAELRTELAKELGLTAQKLMRCAAIWQALEQLGEDMSGIKDGFTFYLPHIAAGSVLPELVVAFARQPALLKRLSRLTPDDQRRMVDGEPVPFVVKPGELRMLPVRCLTSRQVKQVVGDGAIFTEREQIARLCDPPQKAKPGKAARVGRCRVDRMAGLIFIGRSFAPISDAVGALRTAGEVE